MSSQGKPLISVVVPVYNVEKYLAECLDSILAQTYQNLEIIVVNDGSTDGSPKIVQKYSAKHKSIVVVNKKNGGLSSARNAGIEKATGGYLCFVDSDDMIAPDFIEKLAAAMNPEEGILLSTCRYTRRSSDLGKVEDSGTKVVDAKEYLVKTYYQNNAALYSVTVATKMFAKQLFEKVRFPVGALYEDFAIIDQLVLQSKSVALVDKALYYYRRSEGSITTTKIDERHLDMIKHCDKLLTKYADDNELSEALTTMKFTRYIELLTKLAESKSQSNTLEAEARKFILDNRKAILKNANARKSVRLSAILSFAGIGAMVRSNVLRRKIMAR